MVAAKEGGRDGLVTAVGRRMGEPLVHANFLFLGLHDCYKCSFHNYKAVCILMYISVNAVFHYQKKC